MLNIGFLCSGALGLHVLKELESTIRPQFLFTDKNSDEIVDFGNKHSIPIFVGNPRRNDPTEFLEAFQTDIIFSVNYLFIVENNILNHPRKYAINIHGSLLPKYRGRTPHVWAIINGEKETGITAHIMEAGCDTGDVVLQHTINILPECRGADILDEYKTIYPQMISKIIYNIENESLKKTEQDNSKATYFGRRTSDDGEINWDWHKERIKNWIRAQANPYPGAFSYYKGKKVIIDKISFSDHGYEESMPNGLIIKTTPELLVKAPNGVVILNQIRDREELIFKENEKFEKHANK